MAWRRLNPWPAFADMTLMLFLCTVAVASLNQRAEQERLRLEKENAELARQVRELQKDRAVCGGAGPFLQELQGCMAAAGRVVTARDCRITVSEDLVRFEVNKARILAEYRQNAATLGSCVIRAEQAFVDQHQRMGVAATAIDTIFIDGHTDCQGTERRNLELGSERAQALFHIIDGRLRREPQRSRLLRKLAVRSFGASRPTPHSACLERDEQDVALDRRVTIAVAQSIRTGGDADVRPPP